MDEMIRVYTDEFLVYTLHYKLGSGNWNNGDGHIWIFELSKLDAVKKSIIQNFIEALDELISDSRRKKMNDAN